MDRVSTKQRREASRLYKDARDRLETKTEMRCIVFLQRREGSKQKQRCEASRFYKDARDRVSIKQRRDASRLYKDAKDRVSTKTETRCIASLQKRAVGESKSVCFF